MGPAVPPTNDIVERTAVIHHEIFQLSLLILFAVAAFLLTRAVAASNRDMNLRDAGEWYARGQQALAAGHVDDAIDSLRRATVRDRLDKRYTFTLAQALVRSGDTDAGRSLLLALRESAPEDAEINLQLARLAATRLDVTEAVRFYHNTLYAAWPDERADARRQVRVELIRFLLTHGQASNALSELIALSADLPDKIALRLQAAQLFAQAGDSAHALDQFLRVLQLTPDNSTAVAGAGRAAFELGNYALARTYLRKLPAGLEDVGMIVDIVEAVLSRDPLANRLGSAERRRRLIDNFSYARQRLRSCFEAGSLLATSDAVALQSEALAFETQLNARVLEQDIIEMGSELVDRIEQLVVQRCGVPRTLDRALVLIGRQHGAQTR